MIGPEHESLRPGTGEGFADAVTVAFGDPQAEVHGLVRIGIQPGEPATASGWRTGITQRTPTSRSASAVRQSGSSTVTRGSLSSG